LLFVGGGSQIRELSVQWAEGIPTQGREAMHKRCIVKLDKEERKQLAELVKKEKVAAMKPTLCRR
jgi:hypothetical protein